MTTHPYYETGPAEWIRKRADEHGVRIDLDFDLEVAGYARSDKPTIVARPGLALPTFLWLVSSGIVGNRFGFEVTPDLLVSKGGASVRGLSVLRPGHLHLITGGSR